MHFDLASIIRWGGLLVIGLIIYGESGIMIGFFLPGDTLLLSAGLFAAQGQLSLGLTIAVTAVAAILGDNTGYMIGRVMGRRLFRKKDGLVFRQEYVARAEHFYEKYGAKTMLVSHYIPIVRSFAPVVAGVGKMSHVQFFIYDAIGTATWAASVTLVGYWFGSRIPHLERYIVPTIILATIVTFTPMLWHLLGDRETRRKLRARLATSLRRKAKEIDPDSKEQ